MKGLLGQVGGEFVVGLAAIAAVMLLFALVAITVALCRYSRRRVRARRQRVGIEARQVLTDGFATIRQQRQQDAHEARIQLLRAAHEAMQERERQRQDRGNR